MSNSIDERIVSIKFNNSQFEASVRTTMSTLDGLKKSLDFSAGVTALADLDNAGKKVGGNLKFDNAGFKASVKETVDATNNLKSNLKFDGVTKGLNDLDAAGKKVRINLDATAFQNGARGIVDAANTIKQNLNFESVQRSWGNMKSSVQNFSMQNVVTGFQNARQSLSDLDLGAKAVSFIPITDGAEKAKQSISMMSVAGIAAIGALAFKAATVGADLAKQFFIDPAKSGLEEYETNLGSIQTILSNTQWENKSLGDVNGKLDELNAYSDKTIYNFAQMADSIGRFTSAGVSLDDSTSAIKGISNLAALSGSNSQQAATAMQQLSQEMAAGKVGLEGWNSVVSAGMGGKVFQDALIETARNQGSNVDALIAKNGSFRQSLQDGWITTKVMNETLSKMTGDLTDEQLKTMGYNEEQIVGIQKMARSAQDAATKIKTFSQLTGTLSETTGSGWSQTWKLIIGDFEQAKDVWTKAYGALGKIVQGSADARNNMLTEWNKMGGRDVMIDAVAQSFWLLQQVLEPVTKAFREVFPPTTGKDLYNITVAIRNFIVWLRPSQEQINFMTQAFKLFFTILKIGLDILKGAFGVIYAFFKAFATGGDSISGSLKPLTDSLAEISKRIQDSKFIENFFSHLNKLAAAMGATVSRVVTIVGLLIAAFVKLMAPAQAFVALKLNHLLDHFWYVIDTIQWLFEYVLPGVFDTAISVIKAFLSGGMEAALKAFRDSLTMVGDVGELAMTRVSERIKSIQRFAERLATAWDQVMESLGRVWDKMLPLREAVAELFRDLGNELKNVFGDVNFDDTIDMVNTGLLAGLVLVFRNMFKKLLGMGDGMKDGLMKHLDTTVESINGVLEGLTGTLAAMQQNLQADTLMKIAIAIGIMTISVIALSMIDSGKLTKALIGIAVMVVILGKAMDALDKISIGSGFLKLPLIAGSMILLAIALAILVIPVKQLSELSWGELLKGLTGTIALLIGLSKAAETMAKNPANLIATGIGLIAVAIAIKILASAVKDISELSFGNMIKGLIGVGVLLTALSIFNNMNKVQKGSLANAAGLILLGIALKIMASALSDFAAMDVGNMIQGLIAMGAVLLILSKFTSVARPEDVLKSAAAMLILGISLKIIASAMGDFASFSWEDIAKGLIIMTVALKAISQAMARVPPNLLTSALGFVAIAIAMKVLASALKDFGSMSWEEIAKGLTVLAASLILISVALIAMAGTLSGAAALLVVALALGILAPVLKQFAEMSWEQMLHGFAALAGIFVIFGLAGLLLAPLVPVLFALGISMGMLGLGLLGVGIGTVLFATGLIAIATAVAVAGPILVTFIASLLAMIPLALVEFGKGIIAFAEVIGGAMPTFLNAFVALLNTLLKAIQMVFPQLMATLWTIIEGLVGLLVKGIPLFVDAGYKIVIGILKGIGDNIGALIDAGAKIVVEFLNGIGRNAKQVTDAAADMVIKFVNGLADTIETKSEEMRAAGLRLAGALIDGMTGGLASKAKEVWEGAMKIGGDAINAIKSAIDSHSPSKKAFKLGEYTTQGLAGGITSLSGMVRTAATGVGETALDALSKSVNGIGAALDAEVDMSPVIRPVLDLTSIKKDSGLIGGMIKPPTLEVEGTYSKAASLATMRAQAEEVQQSKSAAASDQAVKQIIFNQENHSPKALSEIEIYRKTNNQISTLKGLVDQGAI